MPPNHEPNIFIGNSGFVVQAAQIHGGVHLYEATTLPERQVAIGNIPRQSPDFQPRQTLIDQISVAANCALVGLRGTGKRSSLHNMHASKLTTTAWW